MKHFHRIVILTGAGISAESGLGTFRDKDGLWTKYDLAEVATPEGFARNPAFVHQFYNERRHGLLTAAPHAAHFALARLEAEYPGEVLLVTQNVDDLHERAGSRNIIHMHGELTRVRCDACGTVFDERGDIGTASVCAACGRAGALRPHIVWFGEIPFGMEEIYEALEACDLFVSIGTSGTVYPAAGFVAHVRRRRKALTVELNLDPSDGHSLFAERRYGPASEIVPAFVDELLAGKD